MHKEERTLKALEQFQMQSYLLINEWAKKVIYLLRENAEEHRQKVEAFYLPLTFYQHLRNLTTNQSHFVKKIWSVASVLKQIYNI